MSSRKESRARLATIDGHCPATIGEVVEDRVAQTGPTQDFVYLDIGSVDRESKTFVDLKTMPLSEAPSRARQVVQAADVLVSMTRPNLNAVAMAVDVEGEAIASTGFHILRSPWLEPKFLYYLVQTEAFVQSLSAVVQGALYPAVRPKDISSFLFNLPPRAEQSRIVEKLDELLSDLDAAVAELKAAQRKLAQYRQSLLKAAVEGALTADWRAARVSYAHLSATSRPPARASTGLAYPGVRDAGLHGQDLPETGADLLQRILAERRARWEQKQLARYAEQGKTPPKGWQAKYPKPAVPDTTDLPPLPEGWVWASVDQLSPDDLANGRSVPTAETGGAKVLRLTAVRNGRIDLNEWKHGAWSGADAAPFAVSDGDLLVVRGNGSLTLVGRAGLVEGVREQVAYPDTMIRLRTLERVVRPAWLALVWDNQTTRAHLEARARTSAGIYKISQPDIVSVAVPVPPLEEQDQVLTEFDRSISGSSSMKDALELALNQAAAQRKNLLKAAFAGQLVPQDPADEPASTLLERIRAAKAESAGKNRSRAQ